MTVLALLDPRYFRGAHKQYPRRIAALSRLVARGRPAYGPDALREDFARFRFLLGITDGEGLFSPDEQ